MLYIKMQANRVVYSIPWNIAIYLPHIFNYFVIPYHHLLLQYPIYPLRNSYIHTNPPSIHYRQNPSSCSPRKPYQTPFSLQSSMHGLSSRHTQDTTTYYTFIFKPPNPQPHPQTQLHPYKQHHTPSPNLIPLQKPQTPRSYIHTLPITTTHPHRP